MDGRFPTVSEIDRRCPLVALQIEVLKGEPARKARRERSR